MCSVWLLGAVWVCINPIEAYTELGIEYADIDKDIMLTQSRRELVVILSSENADPTAFTAKNAEAWAIVKNDPYLGELPDFTENRCICVGNINYIRDVTLELMPSVDEVKETINMQSKVFSSLLVVADSLKVVATGWRSSYFALQKAQKEEAKTLKPLDCNKSCFTKCRRHKQLLLLPSYFANMNQQLLC
jgi:hypothetical protein